MSKRLFLLFVLGCSSAKEEKTLSPDSKSDAVGSEQPKQKSPATTAPNPLQGKSLAEICENDELALIKWSFASLVNDFAGLCCKPGGLQDDARCELDWPSSDVPSCDIYDEMRNGIFARYGYPFSSAKWQKTFAEKPWYTKRDDFSNDWLTKEAIANITLLKSHKRDRVNCMD